MKTFRQFLEDQDDLDDMVGHDFHIDFPKLTRYFIKEMREYAGMKVQDQARNGKERLLVSLVEEHEIFFIHGAVNPDKGNIEFGIYVSGKKDHEGGWNFDFDKYVGKEETLARDLTEEAESWIGGFFAHRDDPDMGE